jgi:hypothetical protein
MTEISISTPLVWPVTASDARPAAAPRRRPYAEMLQTMFDATVRRLGLGQRSRDSSMFDETDLRRPLPPCQANPAVIAVLSGGPRTNA